MTPRDLAIEAIRSGSVVIAIGGVFVILTFLRHLLDWLISCRWRPISTAPQDGTKLLLLIWLQDFGTAHTIGWSAGNNKWHYDLDCWKALPDNVVVPRAWRPLPRSPKWAEREA